MTSSRQRKLLGKILQRITILIGRLEDRFDDEDAIKISEKLRHLFVALSKISSILPGPWKYIIELVLIILSMIEDDGDITSSDLKILIDNREKIKNLIKELSNVTR